MTKIVFGCLWIGVTVTVLAWKVESMRIRIVIGISAALLVAGTFLLALGQGGDG